MVTVSKDGEQRAAALQGPGEALSSSYITGGRTNKGRVNFGDG